VLLLDEPTAALDPEQRRRLWARVAALRERGGAVVFATQNLEEIEQVADRVAALREGRLVYVGSDRAQVEMLSA
jgi:ABC-type multidrug transport system ATPase subunit